MGDDRQDQMMEFVKNLGAAMGLTLDVNAEWIDDGTRITVAGDGCDIFLKQKGAGLDALQHVVNAAFRRDHPEGHIVVDCLDYRKGQDEELRQTARLLAERAVETGEIQEIGPLNPYARRIVHLIVVDVPGASSESIGDAFVKTILITADD